MKEGFLHYLWNYQLFDISKLTTVQGDAITILKRGIYNHNSGPDFLNSKIEIANQLWFGNIKIHSKLSDWHEYQHETNFKHNTLILVVVWDCDTPVFVTNNSPIAILQLQQFVSQNLLDKYESLMVKNRYWIPCEKEIHTVDSFHFNNWLEKLFINRLVLNSKNIALLLNISNNDWEAVLFQLLAKNFGLKINGDSFLKLAVSIPFSVLRKEQHDITKLSALFFGQAGFLSETVEGSYHAVLKKEYTYLKHKYKLSPMLKKEFQFFRMRPLNFPTIRIAQLIALYHRYQNLFSLLMELKTIDSLYQLFTIEVPEFWNSHLSFEKESKIIKKKLSKPFLDLVFINTIIPLQFCYQQSINSLNEELLFEKMKGLKPEKNSIISKFSALKIEAKNAFESQALLELKNNYCESKRCLDCAIGSQLLRN